MRRVRVSALFLLVLALAACGVRPTSAPLEPLALSTSGALDPSYGVGGIGRTVGHNTRLNSFAVQTDGQVLLLMFTANSQGSRSQLERFKADGQPDRTFGDSGGLTFSGAQGLVALLCPQGANHYNDWGAACEDQPRPVVALVAVGTGQLSLRRFLPSGQPDPSFGQGGVALTPFVLGQGVAIAIQADGKTVVAGQTAVARLTRNGRPDPTFGICGFVALTLPPDSSLADMVLDDAERILVLNNVGTDASVSHMQVLRLTPDGRPDVHYGTAGQASLNSEPQGQGRTLLKLNNDSLMVGGLHGLWRVLPSGVPDPTFGVGGHASFPTASGFQVTDLAQDEDDQLMASVLTASQYRPLYQGNLARFRLNGRLDPSFGLAGVSSVSLCPQCVQTGGLAKFDGVAVARGGRLLGVGTSGRGSHVLVARMLP